MMTLIEVSGAILTVCIAAYAVWGIACEKTANYDDGTWDDDVGLQLGMPVLSDDTLILKRRYDDLFGTGSAPQKIRTLTDRQ
jgi:hypothetical protein